MVDVDAVRIDRDWRERQSREFKPLPGERKPRLFHPGFLSFNAEHPEREPQPGAISARDDDLRRRTVDAAGDGKIARNLSPELALAAPIWIDGCRARFNPDSLCADAREERCRKGLRRRDAHLEEGGPLGHLLIDFQERPGIWPLLALHHRARTRGDSGAGRAGRDDQLGCVQLLIGRPHGAPGNAELGGKVLPRGQAGAGFEHAAFDRGRNSVSDLLGERRLGGAINDVVVQVHASGFTSGELTWPSTWTDRLGRDRTPVIPGQELAGVVTALGYGTRGLSVGQRVFGLTDSYRGGTLAEYVAIEARNLAPLPGDVDFTVGASVAMPGLTAWQGLIEHGRLQAGQSVLVHGAAGAVGSMVTQLAREFGGYVIGTGRAADRQKALDFGAQEFVDLDNDTLEDVGGVDLVFDVIGGDIGKRSAGLIRAGGTLVTIAGPTEARPADGLAIDFVLVSDRAQLSQIVQRVRDGRLRTNIGNIATLDDPVAAFNRTDRRKRKTIIRVRP